MKPIIGIVEWPYIDKDGDEIFEVFNDIINCVIRAGGIPIGVFPSQVEEYVRKSVSEIELMNFEQASDIHRILDSCDAVIKPGALRIYPYEKLIYGYTIGKNIPYLGICAGMQLMSAYNSRLNNVRISDDNPIKHYQIGYGHDVYPVENTLLSKIVGNEKFPVYSRHRYHIANEGVNRISGVSEDGIIEAIENPNCNYNLGVQWHPELAPSDDEISKKLFESLVEEAKVYRKIKR